jgi:hypothetical protein
MKRTGNAFDHESERLSLLKNTVFQQTASGTRRCRHFQTRQVFENEATQKPRFLLCVLKKFREGLFQQTAKDAFKRTKRKRPALAGPAFSEARNILLLRRGSRSSRGRSSSRSGSVSLRGFSSSRGSRGSSRGSSFFLLAGDDAEGQHGGKQDGDLLHDLISFMECGLQTEQIGDRVGDLYQRPHILRKSAKSSIAIIAFQDSAF